MSETWLPVVDYEGLYEVSDLGRVRNRHGHVMAQVLDDWNRSRICLSRNGMKFTAKVGTLVLEAHVCLRPAGLEVLHVNDIQSDNRLVNLRWGTKSENGFDAVRNGKHHMARKTKCDKGHDLDGVARRKGKTQRYCKQCNRDRNNAKYRETHGQVRAYATRA